MVSAALGHEGVTLAYPVGRFERPKSCEVCGRAGATHVTPDGHYVHLFCAQRCKLTESPPGKIRRMVEREPLSVDLVITALLIALVGTLLVMGW